MIAFEKSEIGRYLPGLKPGGLVLVNDYSIVPITVSSGGATYPGDKELREAVGQYTDKAYWVKGVEIAGQLGNTKTANVVLLGALSRLMEMEADAWLEVIKKRVPPKFVELNEKAFLQGRSMV